MSDTETIFYYIGIAIVAYLVGWMYFANRRSVDKPTPLPANNEVPPKQPVPPVAPIALAPANSILETVCSGCGAKSVIDQSAPPKPCEYCGTIQARHS
jgi:hypothetical protein